MKHINKIFSFLVVTSLLLTTSLSIYAANREPTAVVFVVDRSYSMKGQFIERMKLALITSLGEFSSSDYVGVVAFDSQPYLPVPLEPLSNVSKVVQLIERIQASGQTDIYPALGIAFRLLRDLDITNKHVILVSDGDTLPGEFEKLLERMRERGITVSSVAVRSELGNPGLMKTLAAWGGGVSRVSLDTFSSIQLQVKEIIKWAIAQSAANSVSNDQETNTIFIDAVLLDQYGGSIQYSLSGDDVEPKIMQCQSDFNVAELSAIYNALPDAYAGYIMKSLSCSEN